jgi:hypothetical protein
MFTTNSEVSGLFSTFYEVCAATAKARGSSCKTGLSASVTRRRLLDETIELVHCEGDPCLACLDEPELKIINWLYRASPS